ncbi:MAG: DNA-binding protein [Cyanobacteriota bacterium]|nr:DNA-binding protein [Cyanobacteriota bacterium]
MTHTDTVGTTEAAFLLNISTARLRLLLRQGRLKGAKKVKRFWVIPLNRRGMPEITPGRRGPQGTWNKGFRTGNTFIHVLRKEIDYNRDNGTSLPVISVKQGGTNKRCHEVEILGNCKIVYRPHKPNRSQAGGARLWIEVEPDIQIIRKSFPDTEPEENQPQGFG